MFSALDGYFLDLVKIESISLLVDRCIYCLCKTHKKNIARGNAETGKKKRLGDNASLLPSTEGGFHNKNINT